MRSSKKEKRASSASCSAPKHKTESATADSADPELQRSSKRAAFVVFFFFSDLDGLALVDVEAHKGLAHVELREHQRERAPVRLLRLEPPAASEPALCVTSRRGTASAKLGDGAANARSCDSGMRGAAIRGCE
eukprot:2190865-Rhodomonas_salina.1